MRLRGVVVLQGIRLFIMAGTLLSTAAFANSAHLVTSPFTRQNIYRLVTKDETAGTDLAPGVYRIGKKPVQILNGNVLDVSEAFNGLLTQLNMTTTTGREEALVLMDGRLTLFTNRTTPTAKRSFVTFGGNTEVLDGLMMRPFKLNTINSVEDVHVQTYSNLGKSSGELLLISVRQPNPMGTGITFAVIVEPESDLSKTTDLKLRTPPLIVDYDFLGREAMSRLRRACDNTQCLLSRSHLMSLAQPSPGDDRILREWRDLLGRVSQEIKSGSRVSTTLLERPASEVGGQGLIPPRLDMNRGSLLYSQFPQQVLSQRPFVITQRMDPLGARSGVFVRRPTGYAQAYAPENKPQIPGAVAFAARTSKYRIVDLLTYGRGREELSDHSKHPASSRSLVLLNVDNHPWVAMMGNSDQAIVAQLDSDFDFSNCSKLSGLHQVVSLETETNAVGHVVFVSYECSKRERGTIAFLIEESSDRVVQTGRVKLSNTFMDPVELKDRLMVWNDRYLFDNVSDKNQVQRRADGEKPDPQLEATHETFNGIPTTPFVDVLKSLQKAPTQHYLHYQRSYKIDTGLEYRVYNRRGAINSWTGFYMKGHESWPSEMVSSRDKSMAMHESGYLLTKPDPDNSKEQTPIIISRKLKSENKTIGVLTATPVSAADPETKTIGYFNMMFYLRSEGSGIETVSSLTASMVKIPFANLMGGQIVQGRRQAGNYATLILFFSGSNASGAYAIPLQYGERKEGGVSRWIVTAGDGAWLMKGDFNPATIKSRVIFDSSGTAYWIDAPDLERFDSKYTVRSLMIDPSQTHHVNRPGFRAVLRHDETLDDADGSYFGGDRWRVTYSGELASKYKGLADFFNEQRKASKKKRASDNLFPELPKYLASLADPTTKPEQEVLLVERDLKDRVQKEIFWRFVDAPEGAKWNLDNEHFALHDFDPSSAPERMERELDKLGRKPGRKDVLMMDIAKVIETDEIDPPLSMKSGGTYEAEAEESGDTAKDGSSTANNESSESEDESEDEEESSSKTKRDQSGIEDGSVKMIGLGDEDDEKARFEYSRTALVSLQGMPARPENLGLKAPARFHTVILATPDQWRHHIESFPKEARAGVFERFKVNARFLTGSWSVWAPNSSRASDRVKKASREPISRDEFSIFQELDRTLVEMSDPNAAKHQRILVVPEEVKEYIKALITTRWASNSKEMVGSWNYRNPDLALFEVTAHDGLTQDAIADNFESMRGAASVGRSVLYGDMAEIIKAGRPASRDEDHTFRLRDPVLTGQNNSSLIEKSSGEHVEELERRTVPHLLWWLATEGRKIQPKKAREWSVRSEVEPTIPMLIVATEKEMESLRQQTAFESRFLDVNKHFEVTRLEKPSVEAKIGLVQDLFNRSDIASLGYKFMHEGLSSEEARRQLIGLFVSRIEQIARQLGKEPTDAFTQTFVTFKRALTEDFADLRRTGVIDRFYLERLFAKVFPLPLSYDVLPATDFLHRFRDPNRAARGLTESGYEGALELKERIARNISSQTKGVNDNGVKVPSSFILFGDTSTGKTFLVETAIKYAGLKEYDFDRPNEEAQAMIIKTQTIAESREKAKPGQMTIEDLMDHIFNFLASNNGHRGLLLFDDLHKTQSKEIWKRLKTFIESLLDAEGGLITVKRMGDHSPLVKVPVRNLILAMTVNPQDDENIRRKYVKGYDDIVGEVMAALNKPDYDPVDRSHFARWSDKIDLRKFPRDAKVPTLLKNLRQANAQSFAARPNVVLVTARTMDEVGESFQDANAREFLNPATFALLEAPNQQPKAPIYIVDRQRYRDEGAGAAEGGLFTPKARVLQASEVEAFVKTKTVQFPVTNKNATSKLHLLSFMLDNFRAQLYSALVLGGQSSPKLSDNEELRNSELLSFLLATLSNIEEFPSVPLRDVLMRPTDFRLHDIEAIATLEEDIQRLSVPTRRPFLRVELQGSSEEEELTLDTFLSGRSNSRMGRRRIDVMVETARQIEEKITPAFARFFRMNDLRLAQTPQDWLTSIKDAEIKDALKDVSAALVNIYAHFQAELYDADLEEMRNSSQFAKMNIYDRARLFLLCLDRAVTRLPWGHFTQFMVDAMEAAATDLTLSQRTEFQDFLFASKFSPFNTVTPDTVVSLAQAVSQVKAFPKEKHQEFAERFDQRCSDFLLIPGEPQK